MLKTVNKWAKFWLDIWTYFWLAVIFAVGSLLLVLFLGGCAAQHDTGPPKPSGYVVEKDKVSGK